MVGKIETMASLFEWQRQQKSLKDAERNRLKRASSFNHKYRGGVHVIKHQKHQKILKKPSAKEGGEH